MDKLDNWNLQSWLKLNPFVNPFGITLNLKHRLNNIAVDLYECQKALRYFMNRLNRKMLKGRYSRGKQRLNVIPTYNVGKFKERQHYHLMVDIPKVNKTEDIENIINDCWSKVQQSYGKAFVEKVYSDGWFHYSTKLKSNKDFVDCNNLFLAQTPV